MIITMGRRRTVVSVVRLLARLGWQRDPERWTIRCRTMRGRRASLRISLAANGVMVSASAPGPWIVTGLRIGRLRAALADAAVTGGLLSQDRPRRARSHTAVPAPQPRRRVNLHVPDATKRPEVGHGWPVRRAI